jgi:hypothetical protein
MCNVQCKNSRTLVPVLPNTIFPILYLKSFLTKRICEKIIQILKKYCKPNFLGGSATPCASPPPPSIFSDYSFWVHHLVNWDDRHLLAHAMASDFSVAWHCEPNLSYSTSILQKFSKVIAKNLSYQKILIDSHKFIKWNSYVQIFVTFGRIGAWRDSSRWSAVSGPATVPRHQSLIELTEWLD